MIFRIFIYDCNGKLGPGKGYGTKVEAENTGKIYEECAAAEEETFSRNA